MFCAILILLKGGDKITYEKEDFYKR
jgi:hypothetical protein